MPRIARYASPVAMLDARAALAAPQDIHAEARDDGGVALDGGHVRLDSIEETELEDDEDEADGVDATTEPGVPRSPRRFGEDRGTPPRIQRLLVEHHRSKDPRACDELVRHYLPLAERLTQRYRHTSEPWEDLVQVASLALVKAIKNYDPSRRIPFEGYAIPTIQGQLKRHFRDATWAVRVPRRSQEAMLKLGDAIDRLSVRLGRSPTVPELARQLKLDEEQVLEALQVQGVYDAASLDAPLRGVEDEARSLQDALGASDAEFHRAEQRQALVDAARDLDDRDRELLRLRFVEDLTQQEIGQRLGCSQMQVSRLLRRIVDQLRERLEGAGDAMPDALVDDGLEDPAGRLAAL